MVVAVRHEDGTLHPEDDSPQATNNFLLNPMNMPKHGIEDFRILDPWVGSIYAWVLEDVMPYSDPIVYLPRQGAVIFVKLDGRVPSDSINKAPPNLEHKLDSCFDHLVVMKLTCLSISTSHFHSDVGSFQTLRKT